MERKEEHQQHNTDKTWNCCIFSGQNPINFSLRMRSRLAFGLLPFSRTPFDEIKTHIRNRRTAIEPTCAIWKISGESQNWAMGVTGIYHGCTWLPDFTEHYQAMMGQHINKVTYYTANGIYEIPVGGEEGLYVPVKFDTSAVAVADAELKDGETSVATTISGLTLPEGFDAEYTVDGATAIVKGEKLILKDVKKGHTH